MDYNFDINHASKYGVEEAIVLKNLIYWIRQNKANGKSYIEGRTWTYNTIEAWGKQYPFWSKDKLWRILNSLKKQGVILKHCLSGHDRTTYYAVVDEEMLELPDSLDVPRNSSEEDAEDATDSQPEDHSEQDKKDSTPAAEEIYNYYKINVTPGRKGKAIKNIKKVLKKYKKDFLISCIKNYLKKCTKENTQFKIHPQNFFGESEDFKDYISKPDMKLKDPNPNCKWCDGKGALYIQATGRTKICTCRILSKGGQSDD